MAHTSCDKRQARSVRPRRRMPLLSSLGGVLCWTGPRLCRPPPGWPSSPYSFTTAFRRLEVLVVVVPGGLASWWESSPPRLEPDPVSGYVRAAP